MFGPMKKLINIYYEKVIGFGCLIGNYVLCKILQLVKLAKRLKKEKVNVDIVNFGEEVKHTAFVSLLGFSPFYFHATCSPVVD